MEIFDPNTWTLQRAFRALLMACVIAGIMVVATTWKALRPNGPGLQKRYWRACAGAMWIAIAGLLVATLMPSDRFDAESNLIGETPPQIAMAFLVFELALVAALTGFVVSGAWALRRRLGRRNAG